MSHLDDVEAEVNRLLEEIRDSLTTIHWDGYGWTGDLVKVESAINNLEILVGVTNKMFLNIHEILDVNVSREDE